MAELTPLENLILMRHGIMTHAATVVGLTDMPDDNSLAEIIIRDHPEKDYINKQTLMFAIKSLRKRNILK